MANRIGQQLGNYRLIRLLGQGGFAEVYLAEHNVLRTMVAIKILYTRVTEEDVAQFQHEARLLASLKHPHIVRVFDFGLDGQIPYLVMDYAPNGTLRTHYSRGTRLPTSTVVGYIKQIAQALQYAHDRKIVHRDIKPENMLIGEYNEILLSDFGIALIAHSSHYQSTKDMAGTITYMAPEQIAAHPRPASDQYSLGVVAYEWLSGTVPFHGSFTEIAIKHSVTPPPSPRDHMPTLSPDVEYVILKALAKQPEERFVSVSAFAAALEQANQDMLPTEQRSRLINTSSPGYSPFPISSRSSAPMPSKGIVMTPQVQKSVVPPPVMNTAQSHRFTPLPAPTNQVPSALPTPMKTTDKPRTGVSRRIVLIGTIGGIASIATFGISTFVTTQSHQPLIYRGHSKAINSVAWSHNGNYVASCSDDNIVQVWNANNGSNVFTYTGNSNVVMSVAWSLDGQRIASGSDTVQVWNATNGSNVLTYQGHSGLVYAVAWSPDGKQIASGSNDNTVQVWNASNANTVFTYRGHSSKVLAVAWSPDGKKIASGSWDSTVQVWNTDDGSNVFTFAGHSEGAYAVAWSPDSKRIASGSDDNTVQVWNASDGSNVFTYQKHSNTVNSVAWSPDGTRIASASSDKTVQIWNANDGSNVFTYTGHSDEVLSLTWSPDGQRIASGSADKTVQVWQAV